MVELNTIQEVRSYFSLTRDRITMEENKALFNVLLDKFEKYLSTPIFYITPDDELCLGELKVFMSPPLSLKPPKLRFYPYLNVEGRVLSTRHMTSIGVQGLERGIQARLDMSFRFPEEKGYEF